MRRLSAVCALMATSAALSACVDVDANRMKRRIDLAFGGQPVYSTLVVVQIIEQRLTIQEQLYLESIVVKLDAAQVQRFLADPVVSKLLRLIAEEGLEVPSVPPIEVDNQQTAEDCDDLFGPTLEELAAYAQCKVQTCHPDADTVTTPGIVAAVTEAYRELGAQRGDENAQSYMDLGRWACTLDYPGDGGGPSEECDFLPACARLEIHYPGGTRVCLDENREEVENRCAPPPPIVPQGPAACCDFQALITQCSAFPSKRAHVDCAVSALPSGCDWVAEGISTYACCEMPVGRRCP